MAHRLVQAAGAPDIPIRIRFCADAMNCSFNRSEPSIVLGAAMIDHADHEFPGSVAYIEGHEIGHYLSLSNIWLDARHKAVAAQLANLYAGSDFKRDEAQELLADYVGGRMVAFLNKDVHSTMALVREGDSAMYSRSNSDPHPPADVRMYWTRRGFQDGTWRLLPKGYSGFWTGLEISAMRFVRS